jgi:bifunctional non-homologous end joining protein LigD
MDDHRKDMLLRLAGKARGGLRFNEHLDGDGAMIFSHACRLGAEGIVSKQPDRPYRSGRSHSWLKVKNPASPAVHRIEEGSW